MSFLWMLIVGGVIGWLAGLIVGRDIPGGVIGNIIAGIIGSWLGGFLGDFGPKISDFYIFPSLIGAIVLIAIVSLVMRSMGRSTRS
ncbi:GlsB/YeaQ/YmgE family stress response membrane protein [Paenibacillus spiritus]|uniref:GlsB/YeaQ/YmgE family stress response membrane protein n=1 Tax=Paenibacillus spiritus TaxID=2496557 RepID=A0A5J5G2M2_9BACL|nr:MULTISPECIES: GlsB/YeaQ/YmgE family stress response membrane protein [Paenibacillus]KAA9000990.1 GlsB/YeaQ/YmgE family stress response membrane protein [Paenibacillus spiritus]